MVIRTAHNGLPPTSVYSRYAVRTENRPWQSGRIGNPPTQPSQPIPAPFLPQTNYQYYLLHAIAVCIIIAGIALRVASSSLTQSTPTVLKPIVASANRSSVSHPAAAAYVAKPTDRLTIPAINANAPIIKQGVAKDGTIATPDNLWQVSLYTGGQLPGQTGNVIIVGHSGAPGQIGVFRNLPKIAVGSDIAYKTAAGTQYVYQVVSKKSYSVTDPAAKADIYTPTTKPMLHLITCDGAWISSTYSYTQRMIVDAVLLKQ